MADLNDAQSAMIHNPDGADDSGQWSDSWSIEVYDSDSEPVATVSLSPVATPDPEGAEVAEALAELGLELTSDWEAGEYGGAPSWEATVRHSG
jgi:hypothetical protein